MNTTERFHRVMEFKEFDRLPVMEWADWWDKTLSRWCMEGLPYNMDDLKKIRGDQVILYEYLGQIRDDLGLDSQRWLIIGPGSGPKGSSKIEDMKSYLKVREHFYNVRINENYAKLWYKKHKIGDTVILLQLNGFFWFLRRILGFDQLMYAFYDKPDLLHQINKDLCEFNINALKEFFKIDIPDLIIISEDMSYNNGPMISKECFDEFLAPYYKKLVPFIKKNGVIPFVDSDGDVHKLVPWLKEVGIEGILPLEKQSGVDIIKIRQKHPHFRMIGAFDKMVMKDGEAAMRREFERILPVMKQGGYIPSCDHQTPPSVSLEYYRVYVSLLKEYCVKAVQ